MMRTTLSILGGFTVWTVLWCTVNAVLPLVFPASFDAQGATTNGAILLFIVSFSFCDSVLAGYTTARIAKQSARWAARVLASIQLAIGIAVQLAFWDVLPLWFHLAFLGLLVPGILLGERLCRAPSSQLSSPRFWERLLSVLG